MAWLSFTSNRSAEAAIDLRLAELREVLARAERHERPRLIGIELEKYDLRRGKISRALITTQLDWMKAQFG